MNVKEAKKILPKKEFEAFELVLVGHTRRTSAARLKQLIALAKKLRQKYKDLAREQGSDITARGDYELDTSLNDRKVQVFEDLLGQLEHELEKPRPAAPRPPRKAKARDSRDIKNAIADAKKRMGRSKI